MTTAEMDNLVKVRMGEALEEELRKDTNFQQRQKEWRNAAKEFDSMVSMTQEQWFAFERVEDVFLSYNSAYGEAAYKMGLSDGIQIRREQAHLECLNRYLMLLTVRPVQKLSFWGMR